MEKNRKKKPCKRVWRLFLLLIIVMAAALLQGCQKTKEKTEQNTEQAPAKTAEKSEPAKTAEAKKTDPAGNPDETEAAPSDGQERKAAPSVCGRLHVEGTKLVDEKGQPVQLRGISTHGLSWFPQYVNQECFAQLSGQWNANVIRLAMYTGESNGYCTGGDQAGLKDLIRKGVACATENDMYVIIDWHILSDGDPNTHLEEARAFFEEMSREYGSADNVLFEICNEPNGGTGWQQVKTYAQQVIGVIRANAPDSVILVGTPNWCQDVDQAAADPISQYDNLMYTLHFYAATHKEDLRGKMTAALEAGLPIFVSEYGICDASGNGAIDEEQANLWVDLMDQWGVSYVLWNLSNKNESSSILNSGCEKTGGFAPEDLSPCGQWLYRTLTGQRDSAQNTQNGQPQADAGGSAPVETAQNNGPEDAQAVSTFTSNGMEITAVQKNSWESEGTPFYQYELTLKNKSQSAMNSWAVEIPFAGTFQVTDSWNGEYTPQGTVLSISSVDYNGAVAPNGSVTDVGFIVSGSKIMNNK